MEIIKKTTTILPFILLLSACTTIQTKEISVNQSGQEVITEKRAVSIDPSLTGFVSRLINVFTGKPIMNAEPVVIPNPPTEIETKSKPEPVLVPTSEPMPIVKENRTEEENPEKSKCSIKKIVINMSDPSVSIDC